MGTCKGTIRTEEGNRRIFSKLYPYFFATWLSIGKKMCRNINNQKIKKIKRILIIVRRVLLLIKNTLFSVNHSVINTSQ